MGIGHSNLDARLPRVEPRIQSPLRHRRVRHLECNVIGSRNARLPAVLPQRPDAMSCRGWTDGERLPRIVAAETNLELLNRLRAAPDDADDAVVDASGAAALFD